MDDYKVFNIDKFIFDNWEDCYQYMSQTLLDNQRVKSNHYESVLEREKEFPTGLELNTTSNIAIPHAEDASLVLKNSLVLAVLDKPIEVGRMEDSEKTINVDIILMLALKTGDAHLQMLQRLISLFQKQSFVDHLIETKSGSIFYEKLIEEE